MFRRIALCALLVILVVGLAGFQMPANSAPLLPPTGPLGPWRPVRSWYLVATLDAVTVHNDTDPDGPGEIMIVAGGGSGSVTQTTGFPIQLWREASGGNRIPVNTPLAVIPSNQLGDTLALAVAVIDNDETPGWLAWALPAGLGALGAYIDRQVGGDGTTGAAVGEKLGEALADWLDDNEMIGAFEVLHSRTLDQWGSQPLTAGGSGDDVGGPAFPCRSHASRAGNMTVHYTICRVPAVASNLRTYVRVDRLVVHGNGDTFNGEIFAHARVNDGANAPTVRRFPAGGTTSLGDGSTWNINQLLYEARTPTPILNVEVDVWDEDNPSAGDDHDMLGVAPWTFYLPAFALPMNPGEQRTYPYQMRVKGIDGGDVTVHISVILRRE